MGRRPALFDLSLAGALGILGQVEIWTIGDSSTPQDLHALLAVATIAPLAWRRRFPLAAPVLSLAIATVSVARWGVDGLWMVGLLLLAEYSAGRHCPLARSWAVVGLGLVFTAVAGAREDNASVAEFLGNFLFVAVLMVIGPWLAGTALRRRHVEGAEHARAAVGEERLRIARELHDIVGHALGVIVVQAGAERMTLPDDAADTTRATLAAVEQTAREALGEVRRLVDVLRAPGATEAFAPQPGLALVPALIAHVREAGLPAELVVEGSPALLSGGVDLSAYRIVQESLTNVLQHAGRVPTRVVVRYLPHAVELEVVDHGRGPAGVQAQGHGLAGMRERVALYGGTLMLGAEPAGGFAVRVHLPVDSSP